MALTYRQRFYCLIKFPSSEDECYIWEGTKDAAGYGLFKGKRAHRIIWELEISEIPPGKIILHSCDNPSCVNLNHLSIGTHQDNSDDKIRKGRHPIDNSIIYPYMIKHEILVDQLKNYIQQRRIQKGLKV